MQNYLEFIGNELKALTSIPSPSGYTKDVAAYLMKTLSDMDMNHSFLTKATYS